MKTPASPRNTLPASTGLAGRPGLQEKLEQLLQYLSKTTPGRLKLALMAIAALALLCFMSANSIYWNLKQTTQNMGRDTAPSIIAAEKIRATLADVNANAINSFLIADNDGGTVWQSYRQEMAQVHEHLLEAARNITYGEEERAPILVIMRNLTTYERLVGQARGLRNGNFRPDLEAASKLMQETILPATRALDAANFNHLSQRWEQHHQGFHGASPLLFCALLLLVVLLATQTFLLKRMQRMLNPGLLLATLTLLGFSSYAVFSLNHAEAVLAEAKHDAFDSVHALWQARAVACEANAEESFYLLYSEDGERQTKHTGQFIDKTALLVDQPLPTALSKAASGGKFGGFIGVELANVTYPGEAQAARRMLNTWNTYMQLDQQIRALESRGQHRQAIELNIGNQPGQSNWAFAQYDKALEQTLGINQSAFESAIATEDQLLSRFNLLQWLMLAVVLLASLAGLKPRIDEYRFIAS